MTRVPQDQAITRTPRCRTLRFPSGAIAPCLTDHRSHPTADCFHVHPGIPKDNA